MVNPKMKILVVEDMMSMRKVIMKACKEMGFEEFVEAADGNLGWEAISGGAHNIELVISDWNMPNCTGIELLAKVRGDERFKNLPFVMVTAETEAHQVAEAIKLRVDNYISKPIAPPVLKEKIEQVLKKRGLWQAAS